MKKICIITGANGHLGNTILRLLEKSEYELWGLILPQEKGIFSYVHYVKGDICDLASLHPLFKHEPTAHIDVIHTAGIIDISDQISSRLLQVNVEGCKNIISLCKQYHVHRLLYVSSVHAIDNHIKNKEIVESDVFQADKVQGGYAKSKAMATQEVLNACEEGLNAVIVHPSGIVGPYDYGHNHLVQMVTSFASGKLRIGLKGGYDFVDVRDVAKGCILALEKGNTKQCYILSNSYYTIKQVFTMICEITNAKKGIVLPIFIVKAILPLYTWYTKKQNIRPLLTNYSLYTLSCNDHFSHAKATRELGYTTRDLKQTIKDTLFWQ